MSAVLLFAVTISRWLSLLTSNAIAGLICLSCSGNCSTVVLPKVPSPLPEAKVTESLVKPGLPPETTRRSGLLSWLKSPLAAATARRVSMVVAAP